MSITNINQEQFERPMSQSNVNQNHASNPTHCPCGKNSIFGYPPSIPDLIRDFPDVVPDFSIRRDQPRCRSCDYRASMNRYQNWWSDVNKYMVSVSKALHKEYPGDTAMTLRQEGVPGAEDYNARFWLDYRKEVLKEQANRYTEAWKFIAWIPFWSIWGKPVGHKDIVWPEPPARQPLFGGELLFGGLPLDGQQLADDQLLFSADPGLFAAIVSIVFS
ncbi:hypothetical protein B0H67DRAFT_641758 [Lasiosphaeris hirsuta]|uniref:Uncharacterized protein n=1 Tax=Lasiosphaeris hirsuta TaxID=260670 RepID=A0AA40E347_9PEZI|nr:hypothetical protein B0H67DRAFT_641758 [Lasiosphaeris hirsuta]